MRSRGGRAALIVAGALVACNALTGIDDLAVGENAAEDASAPVRDATAPSDAGAQPKDAAEGGPRPSYCDGIVFYAAFDGTLVTSDGISPDPVPVADAGFLPGHYASALDLTQSSALYYAFDGSTSRADGTVALWLRRGATSINGGQTVYKLKADKAPTGATGATPYIAIPAAADAAEGTVILEGGTSAVNTPHVGLSATEFTHLALTWNQGRPSITLTVNGTTTVETDAAWTPAESVVNYVRLSSESNPSFAAYDDFTIWHRELTPAEIAAVAAAPMAIGVACGL